MEDNLFYLFRGMGDDILGNTQTQSNSGASEDAGALVCRFYGQQPLDSSASSLPGACEILESSRITLWVATATQTCRSACQNMTRQ